MALTQFVKPFIRGEKSRRQLKQYFAKNDKQSPGNEEHKSRSKLPVIAMSSLDDNRRVESMFHLKPIDKDPDLHNAPLMLLPPGLSR